MSGLRLCFRYISITVQSVMTYRVSFMLLVLSRFLVAFCGFVSVGFLFSGFEHIRGYSYADVVLCCAVIETSFSLAECISSGFAGFSSLVKRGGFDTVLLRPRSAILQVLGMGFQLERFGGIASGILMLYIGVRLHAAIWSPVWMFTLAAMIAGGTLLFISLFMIGAAICFFAIEESNVLNLLTYGGRDHGKYPVDVYGERMKKLTTFVIPYALVQYYPLQLLIGRSDRWYYALYPLGVLFFLAAAYAFWRFGVRRYTSTGS